MVTAQGRRSLLIAHDRLCEETAVEVKSKYWLSNRILRMSGGADPSSHVMRGRSTDTPQSARGQNKLEREKDLWVYKGIRLDEHRLSVRVDAYCRRAFWEVLLTMIPLVYTSATSFLG